MEIKMKRPPISKNHRKLIFRRFKKTISSQSERVEIFAERERELEEQKKDEHWRGKTIEQKEKLYFQRRRERDRLSLSIYRTISIFLLSYFPILFPLLSWTRGALLKHDDSVSCIFSFLSLIPPLSIQFQKNAFIEQQSLLKAGGHCDFFRMPRTK